MHKAGVLHAAAVLVEPVPINLRLRPVDRPLSGESTLEGFWQLFSGEIAPGSLDF
jgi:hypothetical protein